MHDGREDEPECRWLYHLHTDAGTQQRYLLDRDGKGCMDCGAMVGRWGSGLEVDHTVALALAWVAFGEHPTRFRWFFSPANLKLRCSGCHQTKTAQDRALIRQANALGSEWARATVLRLLADAGQLRVSQPGKGSPCP
jgi:5-methylcytosine-specific restriction endonuclease McrA